MSINVAAGSGDIAATVRPEQGGNLNAAATGFGTVTITAPFYGSDDGETAVGEVGEGTPAGTLNLGTSGDITVSSR